MISLSAFSTLTWAWFTAAQACPENSSSQAIFSKGTRWTVPEDILTEKLTPQEPAADHLGTHNSLNNLFKIDRNGILTGPNITVDLRANPSPLPYHEDFDSFSFNLNGKDQGNDYDTSVVVHEVGRYHVMYDEEGQVLSVRGDNILLNPVDQEKYPGIFKNHRRGSLSLGDDSYATAKESYAYKEPRDGPFPEQTELPDGNERRCRKVHVAVAYDNSFCAQFGNSASRTNKFVTSAISESSRTLQRDTCLRLKISRIEAHCQDINDPYNYLPILSNVTLELRSRAILSSFRQFWLENRSDVKRDVANFFSGYEDQTFRVGAAYTGASCTSYGFGWVERGSQLVFLHEMGHSLGASHTSQGIMREFLTPDAGRCGNWRNHGY